MGNVLVEEAVLSGIASAIRGGLGTEELYYPSQMASMLSAGSVTIPSMSIVANPTISFDSSTGIVTANVTATQGITPSVVSGLIHSATTGSVSVSGASEYGLSVLSASAYTPGVSDVVIPSNVYLTGTQTIYGDQNLVPSNIINGISIYGVSGNYIGDIRGYLYYSDGTSIVVQGSEAINISSVYSGAIISVDFPFCRTVGDNAFADCDTLESINLPLCSYVGNNAFSGCYNLTSISLPLCAYIGESAFDDCDFLESVNLPLCTYVGDNAFIGGFNFCGFVSLPLCSYIGEYAFYFCNIDSIYLPLCSTVGRVAFGSCSVLASVSLPLCSHVDDYAFWDCSSLTSVNLPLCLNVGSNAFKGCYSLTSVSLPLCSYIGESAFYNCSHLTSVSLPLCSYIGRGAFYCCSSLMSLSLPSCSQIEFDAFVMCSKLSTIYLGYSSVCSMTYSGTLSYTPMSDSTYLGYFGSIYVPYSLVDAYKSATCWSIYASRIAGYSNDISDDFWCLADPSFSGTVFDTEGRLSKIRYYQFEKMGITAAFFPACTLIEGYAFRDCASLSQISVPACTSIADRVFMRCSKLTEIHLPSCSFIGDYTFGACTSLATVRIPACETIGANVFSNCQKLASVYLSGSTVCSLGNNAFYNTPMINSAYLGTFGRVYVPTSLVVSYQAATNWSAISARIVGY